MSSSSSPRRRRHHTRSRKGCFTCKDRHIRCDELRPVCTNCLTRGGDCGYPESESAGTTSSSSLQRGRPTRGRSVTGATRSPGSDSPNRLLAPPTPTLLAGGPIVALDVPDPFPVRMLEGSHLLFDHFLRWSVFSRRRIPRNPNSVAVSIAMRDPGLFHGSLLISGMNWFWQNGDVSRIQEAYLHHKLEAIRIVNEALADQNANAVEDVVGTIACLALAESGMGNFEAADTHLRGFYSCLDPNNPQDWDFRLYGLIQRMVLLVGCFLASSPVYANRAPSISLVSESLPLVSRRPSPLFSTCPFNANRLSPYYLGSPPDFDTANCAVEFEVALSALRRLSGLPIFDHRQTPGVPDSVVATWAPSHLSPAQRDILARDAESYLSGYLSHAENFGYASLDPALGHDTSRAWALASYIYLQMVLRGVAIDPNLLLTLLERLRRDLERSEEAMMLDIVAPEFWLWKAVLGAMAAEMLVRQSQVQGQNAPAQQWEMAAALAAWYAEKLPLIYAKFEGADWPAIKRTLSRTVWLWEFAGEVVREQWAAAVQVGSGSEDEASDSDESMSD